MQVATSVSCCSSWALKRLFLGRCPAFAEVRLLKKEPIYDGPCSSSIDGQQSDSFVQKAGEIPAQPLPRAKGEAGCCCDDAVASDFCGRGSVSSKTFVLKLNGIVLPRDPFAVVGTLSIGTVCGSKAHRSDMQNKARNPLTYIYIYLCIYVCILSYTHIYIYIYIY